MLPPVDRCEMDFLQQLLRREKHYINRKACVDIDVPLVPELAVKNLWDAAMRITNFKKYIPDNWTREKNDR